MGNRVRKPAWGRVLTAFATLAIVAGTAFASQSLTHSVAAVPTFTAIGVMTPGAGGAVFSGTSIFDEDVEFSVGFGSNGTISINGSQGPSYDNSHEFEVVVDAIDVSGVWCAAIQVTDRTSGQVLVNEPAVYLGVGQGIGVVAETAASVHSLHVIQ